MVKHIEKSLALADLLTALSEVLDEHEVGGLLCLCPKECPAVPACRKAGGSDALWSARNPRHLACASIDEPEKEDRGLRNVSRRAQIKPINSLGGNGPVT